MSDASIKLPYYIIRNRTHKNWSPRVGIEPPRFNSRSRRPIFVCSVSYYLMISTTFLAHSAYIYLCIYSAFQALQIM